MSDEEMPDCPACGRLHLVSTCVRRLAERMAKLEARVDGGLMVFGPTGNVVGQTRTVKTRPTFEELVAKVGPSASGQLVSAGETIVPSGWKPGDGVWTGCWSSAIVRDEPPAEQPTCVCPFPRNTCPRCRHDCRACLLGRLPPAEQPVILWLPIDEDAEHRTREVANDAAAKRQSRALAAEQPTCGYLNADFPGLTCALAPHATPAPGTVARERHQGRDQQGRTCSWWSEARHEQPSRQETPGGETGEAIDWSRFLPTEDVVTEPSFDDVPVGCVVAEWSTVFGTGCVSERTVGGWVRRAGSGGTTAGHWRIIRHADGRWADGYNPSGPCEKGCGTKGPVAPVNWWHTTSGSFCTSACRDRAKAKAAEKDQCLGCAKVDRHPGEGYGCALHPGRVSPAEPAGTGQLPSAPTGSLWTGSPGNAVELKLPPVDLNVTAEQIREAVKERACVKCHGTKIDRQGRACRYCSWRKEPIAEPPTPAVGTLSARVRHHEDVGAHVWDGLADEVAALEACLAESMATATRYLNSRNAYMEIHDEHIAKLAQAERERDAQQKFHAGERDRWEAMLKRSHDAAENRVANAIRDERERCLAWAEYNGATDTTRDIRAGKPAPGTDKPPKCDPDPPGFPPEFARPGSERPAWSSQSDPPREYEPCGQRYHGSQSCILPKGHGAWHKERDGGCW